MLIKKSTANAVYRAMQMRLAPTCEVCFVMNKNQQLYTSVANFHTKLIKILVSGGRLRGTRSATKTCNITSQSPAEAKEARGLPPDTTLRCPPSQLYYHKLFMAHLRNFTREIGRTDKY